MKTLKLVNTDSSIAINYLTDLIGDNEFLTIYQIRQDGVEGTGNVLLSTEAIQAGVPDKAEDDFDLNYFKTWATDNGWSLYIYENPDSVEVSVANADTDFLSFSLAAQTGAATIDTGAHTVDIEVANGTTVTALVATFTLSNGAIADVSDTVQISGVTANDFTNPVTYTVTAEDGTTEQDWTVTVTVAV